MNPKLEVINIQFKPTGGEKSFSVWIPKQTIQAFEHLDDDEERRILRSVIKVFESQLVKRQNEKDQPIVDLIHAQGKFSPPAADQGVKMLSLLMGGQQPQTDSAVKDAVLPIIKWFRKLNHPDIEPLMKSAVLVAIEENDRDFFIRLGQALKNRSLHYAAPKAWTPLQGLLIHHWVAANENALPFCCFSDEALSNFLACVAQYAAPTFDSVRKTRQRLKLRQTKRKLIKLVEQKGDGIFLR